MAKPSDYITIRRDFYEQLLAETGRWYDIEPGRRPINAEQEAALKQFANSVGRNWRNELAIKFWPNGRVPVDKQGKEYQLLYNLRNSHGPEWLYHYKLETKK